MVRYKNKAERDQLWLASKAWGFPTGLHPSSQEELTRRKARKPLSPEQKEVRRQHMISLHNEGAGFALIGRLYQLERSLVRKIVKGCI